MENDSDTARTQMYCVHMNLINTEGEYTSPGIFENNQNERN